MEGSCAWSSASLAEGAQVLCRGGFGSSPLPADWTVSEAANSSGYYTLEYAGSAEPDPVTYTITFIVPDGIIEDGQDGTVDPYTATTGTDGKLSSLPTAYYNYDSPDAADGSQVLEGWFTLEDGGKQITTGTVFTEDTTVYAHWMEGIEVIFLDYYNFPGDEPYEIQPVAIGGTITQPAPPPGPAIPSRAGPMKRELKLEQCSTLRIPTSRVIWR